jgi:hypothetical protein
MIRTIAKLCVVVAAVATFLPTTPSHAENIVYVSANGSGISCTATAPCASVEQALIDNAPPVRVICLNGSGPSNIGIDYNAPASVDIDCPQGYMAHLGVSLSGTTTLRVRHLGFRYAGVSPLVSFSGSGTLILEDCVFTDATGTALDIEPNGPLNIVIKNSQISNNAAGILLKPAAGGSINATLDHVTVTGNTGTGGGIKTDSADGIVKLDITESEISNNVGVGVNARSGGSQNMVSIKNSVITENTAQGVQANGANVGITVQTTLLDENASGATSVAGGGHISTYGNNSIIGSSGSGFTGTASLQ